MDAVGLQGTAGVGAVGGTVDPEGVVGARLQVEGGGPPAAGGRDHVDQPVIQSLIAGQVKLDPPRRGGPYGNAGAHRQGR